MAKIIFSKSEAGEGEIVIPGRGPVAEIRDDTVVRVDHDLAEIDTIPSDLLIQLRELIRDVGADQFEVEGDVPHVVKRYLGVTRESATDPEPATAEVKSKPTTRGKGKVVTAEADAVIKGTSDTKDS
jgi:hypothetical protein